LNPSGVPAGPNRAPAGPPGRGSPGLGREDGIALALAFLFVVLAFSSSTRKSLTWDEPSYISAGYLYLTRGDFRFNPSHPPLMQDLVALPLLFQDLVVPPEDFPYWESRGNPVVGFGNRFLFQSGNDPRSIAVWARTPILLLGMALVGMVYAWGRKLYGAKPALLGTALVALSPNLLAHSRLATEDLGCAALMFASVWMFWRAVHKPGHGAWLVCGLVTGLALLAKYSSLLLGPIYLALFVALWVRGLPFTRSLRSVATAVGIVTVTSLVVVGAGYNFTFDGSLYVDGMRRIYSDLIPGYQYYFVGEFSESGRWYYALGALLMKTPVTTLLLVVLAVAFTVTDRRHREAALFLLVPALVIVAASFFDTANFGIRRILPALPFLLLFASQTLAGVRRRPVVIGVFVLLAWSASQTLRIHPDYLSYFNVAVGGPRAGPDLLDDSNLDWGQDLPALARWHRAHPEATPLKLMYFGTAEPRAYGVGAEEMSREEIERPRPGYYAVSVHYLIRFRTLGIRTGKDLDWLRRYEPIGRAGWSIYIFRIE